jgi:hypothetical protein
VVVLDAAGRTSFQALQNALTANKRCRCRSSPSTSSSSTATTFAVLR